MAWKPSLYSLPTSKLPNAVTPLNLTEGKVYFTRQQTPDVFWPLGYRSFNGTLKSITDSCLNALKNANITIDLYFSDGLKGKGTVAEPLEVDTEFLANRFFLSTIYPMSCVIRESNLNSLTTNKYAGSLPFTFSGSTLTQTANILTFINGAQRLLTGKAYDLNDLIRNAPGTTLHLYVEAVSSQEGIRLGVSALAKPDTLDNIWIGKLTINSGTGVITAVQTEACCRWGTARVSTTNKGSAIPAKGGSPADLTGGVW